MRFGCFKILASMTQMFYGRDNFRLDISWNNFMKSLEINEEIKNNSNFMLWTIKNPDLIVLYKKLGNQ